jgi:hypothetical protein
MNFKEGRTVVEELGFQSNPFRCCRAVPRCGGRERCRVIAPVVGEPCTYGRSA